MSVKMIDYIVDAGDGEEEICDTKRQAIKRAQELANERKETITIYRWFRPDRYSDLELDESFKLYVEPNS